MTGLLIVNGEVEGVTGLDVRVDNGVVTEVGRALDRSRHEVLNARGGAVLPGLHDHHVHLRALAAAAASVVAGPPAVNNAPELAAALRAASDGSGIGSWVRAIGYHESVAGPMDAATLDAFVADRPVRVQHRSGVLWVLNSEGLRRAQVQDAAEPGVERGGDGRPTGRLWRLDEWLRRRVPAVDADLAAVGRDAARHGVTGFTDADPERSAADAAVLSVLPQRLHLMGPLGFATGGPVKVILDEDALPSLEELADTARAAHAEGRPIAVHCVTRAQLVLGLAAVHDAGAAAGARIEHAAVVPDELLEPLRAVTVVTQPAFIAERGDAYLSDVDADDLPYLYRCRSLLEAGVRVAGGTDAPFGDADPWASVKAAVERRTASGAVLGPRERLAPADALKLFLGEADAPSIVRRVQPRAAADLCVLHCPLGAALADPNAEAVRATVIAGTVVHDANG